MIRFASVLTLLSAGMAQAHPAHMAEVAGHGYWMAAGALAAAIALVLLAARGRKSKETDAAADKVAEDLKPQEV